MEGLHSVTSARQTSEELGHQWALQGTNIKKCYPPVRITNIIATLQYNKEHIYYTDNAPQKL